MSIAEFKQLPFPGGKNSDPPSLICTGEKDKKSKGLSAIEISNEDKSLGVLKCAWFVPSFGPGLMGKDFRQQPYHKYYWNGARVLIGGWNSVHVVYSFIKLPQDSEHRLYEISILITNDGFSDLVSGLRERFGEPTQVESGEVRNKAGTIFPNTTMVWLGEMSTIRLVERVARIDTAWLLYTHTALSEHYLSERKKISGTPGGSL
jgi:hypothetical protein